MTVRQWFRLNRASLFAAHDRRFVDLVALAEIACAPTWDTVAVSSRVDGVPGLSYWQVMEVLRSPEERFDEAFKDVGLAFGVLPKDPAVIRFEEFIRRQAGRVGITE